MAALVFPVSSAPGPRPQSGSGRIINGYAIKTEQGSRSPLEWKRAAGLNRILDLTSHSHSRGLVVSGSTLLHVLSERVYAVTASGTVFSSTNLGALAGDDAITIGVNNAGTPNIVAVTDAGTFNLFTGSAPTSFVDGDLPSVNSVTGANGYLVFSTGGGEIWATGLNAVTVASDAFVSAQMPLYRVIYYRGELFAFGPRGFKVYRETGEDPFPFAYQKVFQPRGLCGTHAIVGGIDGWADEMVWAGEDSIVYKLGLEGYSPSPISNDGVSRAIASASDRSLIEASAYMDGRNAFFVLTSPGEWTWEYNLGTGSWNERRSYARDDWRARQSIRAFDRWIVGDDTTGKLFEVRNDYYREENDPMIWHLESGDNANFPSRIAIPEAFFDFTAGLGNAAGTDPIETDPKVMISWSLNGGGDWGNEITRSLGVQGDYGKLVRVAPVGTTKAKGIRFKLRVSDPVPVGFSGGQMPSVQARAA